MTKKSTTYVINVEAQYKSLENLTQELNKIKTQSNDLGFGKKDSERLEELLLGAQRIRDLINKKSDGSFGLNSSDYKEIDKWLNSFIRKAENFSSSLIQVFTEDLQKSIKDADSKIEGAKTTKRNANLRKGRATAAFNRAADEETKSQTAGLIDDKGQSFNKISDLKKYVDEIKQIKDTTDSISPSQQKILDIWGKIQSKIKSAVDEYEKEWREADASINEANKELEEHIKLRNDLIAKGASGAKDLTPESKKAIEDYTKALDNVSDAQDKNEKQAQEYKKAQIETNAGIKAGTVATQANTKATEKYKTTLGKAVYNVVSYGSALTLVRSITTRLIQTITDMDRALTDMTVVTQLSREQTWGLTGQLQELAAQTGMTSTEVAQMTTMYLQQGQTLSNALELTEAAAKAARIAGISGSESINLLTNAMNGFQMSASQAMEVSDKFAALAAAAATDYEELATALSKVAAQANLAGMSMDFTLGLLTKGIEVTREAPETIGTALKTVISRMRELTDYGETLEDGIDVNRVDTALKNIGVNLLDANREFRDLDLVLTEVGEKWDTLNKNQQANVAVALAGTRQQSRLIAMLQDFDRTQQLVNISMTSAGATAAQHRKYMQGLEAATTALTTSYQKLITNFTNSDIAIAAVNGLSSALNFLGENVGFVYAAGGALLALYAPLITKKIQMTTVTALESLVSVLNREVTNEECDALFDLNEQYDKAKGIKKYILEKIAAIFASTTYKAVLDKEERQLKANAAAQELYNKSILANPYVLIAAAVMALIAVWWGLNKETEAGQKLQENLKNTMQSLMGVLSALFEMFMPIVDIVMFFVNIAITRLASGLRMVTSIIQVLFSWFELLFKLSPLAWLGKLLKKLEGFENNEFIKFITGQFSADLFEKGAQAITGWFDKIGQIFETDSEKADRLAESIAKTQEEIYDNQQTSSTLTPLIDEYEELSKKSVKTAEDLERLKEIETEIGDLDKDAYLNKDGSVNWDAVKKARNEADEIAKQGLENNLKSAKEGLQTGEFKEEFRSAITDYYGNEAKNIEDISATTAANIANNYKAVLDNMSENTLEKLAEDDSSFENIYKSIKDLQIELEKAGDSETYLADGFDAYQKAIANVPDDAKEAFNSMYSLYASYAQMMQKLGVTGSEQIAFLNKAQTLGVTETEYADLFDAYKDFKPGATQDDFYKWFGSAVDKGNTKDEILSLLLGSSGENQELRNAIQSALLLTNQQALENYTKQISSADNLTELSKKAAAGTMTLDDWRTLQADHPDILTDQAKFEKFMAGTYNAADERAKASAELRAELQSQLIAARADGDKAQEKSLKQQLEYLKYAELYNMSIWEEAAKTTAELQRQKQITSELNKLQKKYEGLIGSARKENLAQQAGLYSEMYSMAQKTLQEEVYLKGVQEGWIIDGEVVITQEQLKAEGMEEYWDYLDKNKELIKEAYDNNETAIEGYRNILELQYEQEKELLENRKDSYQNYFDSVDALEEEQERSKSRDDVINQLSALSGGVGSNTKARQKELLQQLEDLNREEEEARKEAAREAVIDSIESHITDIDKNIDELVTKGWSQLLTLMSAQGITLPIASADGQVLANKNGGLIKHTGLTWVDGTKANPEAFLNATDTKLIRNMLDVLMFNLEKPDYNWNFETDKTSEYNESSVVIENITIQAQQLNTKQDFRGAGTELAREFSKIIQERGLNVNVKK